VIRGELLTLVLLSASLALPLRAQTAPLTRFAERKAEVLLREKLPCLGCHQFGEEGGRLAPDLATLRTRRSAEYVAAIIDQPQRVRPGSMMPLHPMLASDRLLIVRYLASRPGAAAVDTSPTLPAAGEDRSAPALYARFCSGCHGTNGAGDGPNARYLPVPPAVHRSAAAMSARPDDALYDAIAGGGAIMNKSPRMPAFGQSLSDTEMRALVRHIRTLCNCEGPAWSIDGQRR
jgi:mono/diheme cytochrome c family protein